MDVVERRDFVRVPFSSDVILTTRNIRIEGRIENISLGGALIVTTEKIDPNTGVEAQIYLDDPPSDESIVMNATVVRLAPEGIAIRFTGMSMEVFERLRELIASIHGDKRKAVAEFLKAMDLKPFCMF